MKNCKCYLRVNTISAALHVGQSRCMLHVTEDLCSLLKGFHGCQKTNALCGACAGVGVREGVAQK